MRAATLASALGGLAAVNAISTISIKGSKFFLEDGNQFFVRGVAYQLSPDDPLVDNTQCSLDAKLMKSLGANSIRVYHVDPSAKHDDCMKTFEDAGIYLWLDLDTFTSQINQDAPMWNQTQLEAFQGVMDSFHQYDNLAGFFVGNEVVTKQNGTVAAPYVKAAARDLKAYRDSKKYRNIPVGYSAADISFNRPMLQDYLACGSNSSEAIDFFALNTYSWCGDSSYQQSGYNERIEESKNLNIPIFISETGCNTPKPRTFEDQASIFGEMTSVYSGAIIYEWLQEENDYGIVSYGSKLEPGAGPPPGGFVRSGTPIPVLPDFTNLSNQWKTLTPATTVKAADYKASLTAVACPSFTSNDAKQWMVSGDITLPTVGAVYQAGDASSTGAKSSGGSESAKPTGSSQGSAQGSPTPSPTQGAAPASPLREMKGMGLGLAGVLLGFFWWM